MSFAYLLKRFRVKKGLSLRKLGELSRIDHAYISRLEKKEKQSPSEEVVEKLVRGLGLDDRDAWLLGFGARFHKYLDPGMIRYIIENAEITQQECSWAMAVRYRVPGKLDYPRLFGCARQLMTTVDDYLVTSNSAGAGT